MQILYTFVTLQYELYAASAHSIFELLNILCTAGDCRSFSTCNFSESPLFLPTCKYSPQKTCSHLPLICVIRLESDQVMHPHKTAHRIVVFSLFILALNLYHSFRVRPSYAPTQNSPQDFSIFILKFSPKGDVIIKYFRITHEVSGRTGRKLFLILICLSTAWTT